MDLTDLAAAAATKWKRDAGVVAAKRCQSERKSSVGESESQQPNKSVWNPRSNSFSAPQSTAPPPACLSAWKRLKVPVVCTIKSLDPPSTVARQIQPASLVTTVDPAPTLWAPSVPLQGPAGLRPLAEPVEHLNPAPSSSRAFRDLRVSVLFAHCIRETGTLIALAQVRRRSPWPKLGATYTSASDRNLASPFRLSPRLLGWMALASSGADGVDQRFPDHSALFSWGQYDAQ
ncbi:uncharacterized protein SRS1_06019 [Sporisorium reilianum f. sp. reilianum]|uniref:Uncharacterized protein n=1 Tax=Sporisorium reilianum f. sp. reilianum TaxID=72559 RepID=A0A2N8UFX7_9BASI|nr:uncharacterized protein SRS1_06019 [Sporisorium reilianum f. sp. reilianum]